MAKRGRPRKNSERKGYFYEEQEEAVVKYVTSTDDKERNEIYEKVLHPAFCKMVESLMNRYKLYVPDEEFKETFDDTLSFLLTKISLFDPSSGYKAYSYCGTICKNYLILKIKNFSKNLKRNDSYEDVQSDLNDSIRLSYNNHDETKTEFLNELIKKTSVNVQKILNENKKLNENEIKIGNALINLLDNWEELSDQMSSNAFNKSSILLFLKETTFLNTKEIRDAMKKFKNAYYITKEKMLSDYL